MREVAVEPTSAWCPYHNIPLAPSPAKDGSLDPVSALRTAMIMRVSTLAAPGPLVNEHRHQPFPMSSKEAVALDRLSLPCAPVDKLKLTYSKPMLIDPVI